MKNLNFFPEQNFRTLFRKTRENWKFRTEDILTTLDLFYKSSQKSN